MHDAGLKSTGGEYSRSLRKLCHQPNLEEESSTAGSAQDLGASTRAGNIRTRKNSVREVEGLPSSGWEAHFGKDRSQGKDLPTDLKIDLRARNSGLISSRRS